MMALAAQQQADSNSPHGHTLKTRVVAASFIFRKRERSPAHYNEEQSSSTSRTITGAEYEVALFRRSGEVRTYQHKLAPISGSMDEEDHGDPKTTAIREIKEETTLEHGRDFQLHLAGKQYSFIDETIGRQWIIHPFSWLLKDTDDGHAGARGEKRVQIDWEHEGWKWFNPKYVNDSDGFGGVPKLLASLRRVWPTFDLGLDASGELLEGIKQLQEDHENGARQLATHAVAILGRVIEKMNSERIDQQWFKKVRIAAWHICHNGRPSMGSAITSAILAALHAIESIILQASAKSSKKRSQILEAMEVQIDRRSTTTYRVQQNFEEYLRHLVLQKFRKPSKTVGILTVSLSSTITSCLIGVIKNLGLHLDMRILESRPRFEGVACASKLLEASDVSGANEGLDTTQLKIRIYTDAAAAYAARGVDLVLLGSDRISTSGDVSNKIGSVPAVLCAREVSPAAKVVILSESDKVAAPGEATEHPIEKNDPSEVIDAWKASDSVTTEAEKLFAPKDGGGKNTNYHVEVENVYFEWIPARLVDVYITEKGQWSTEDVKRRSVWIGDEEAKYFGNL